MKDLLIVNSHSYLKNNYFFIMQHESENVKHFLDAERINIEKFAGMNIETCKRKSRNLRKNC